MNEDQVKGKLKDVGGRIERQAGEWTGNTEQQIHGTAKQAEGKTQKAWGDAKDAVKKGSEQADRALSDAELNDEEEKEEAERRRKAS
jgi:uncharacterized protein YjbJ (UPF0337 family)